MAEGNDCGVVGSVALRTGSDQAWLMLPGVPEKGAIIFFSFFFAFEHHSLNKTEFR